MKPTVPAIAPLLRSDVQGALLAELLLFPAEERTLTDLTKTVNATMPTVHREIERLVSAGFLTERRSGRNRYVRANTEHALHPPVRQIIEYAYGPRPVLSRLLSEIPGVEGAYIYGSWAARMSSEPGRDPADIDVLVIGRPSRANLYDVAEAAQSTLKREVNVRSVSATQWQEAKDPFLQNIASRPLVELSLNSHDQVA